MQQQVKKIQSLSSSSHLPSKLKHYIQQLHKK